LIEKVEEVLSIHGSQRAIYLLMYLRILIPRTPIKARGTVKIKKGAMNKKNPKIFLFVISSVVTWIIQIYPLYYAVLAAQ